MSRAPEAHAINRRDFLAGVAAGAAMASHVFASQDPSAQPAPMTQQQQKLIGIQAGAVSFMDEGVDAVLDIFPRAEINTIFLATFTYGRGIAGRQVPGQPLPDHGKQEY